MLARGDEHRAAREPGSGAVAGCDRAVFGAVEPLVILYPATEETEGPIR